LLSSSIVLSNDDANIFGEKNKNNPQSNRYTQEHTFGSANPQNNLGDYPPIPGLDYQVEQNAPQLPNRNDYNYQQKPASQQRHYNPRGGFVYPPFNYNSPSNVWQYAPQKNRQSDDDMYLNPANPWRIPKYKRY
jgi:hypothetical protein